MSAARRSDQLALTGELFSPIDVDIAISNRFADRFSLKE
jgi:hypothetical protein